MSKNKEKISTCIVELKDMMIDLRDIMDENAEFIKKLDEDLIEYENVKKLKEVVSEAILKQKEDKKSKINLEKLYRTDFTDNKTDQNNISIEDLNEKKVKLEKKNLLNIANNIEKHQSTNKVNYNNKSNVLINKDVNSNNLSFEDNVSEKLVNENDKSSILSDNKKRKELLDDEELIIDNLRREKIEKLMEKDFGDKNNKNRKESDDESSEV